jgi:seryl-tRNA synthetase
MKETTPESSNIMETASYSNERTIVIPNYEEAEALLLKEGINITKFNHDLLNQSIDEREKLIIALNTTNFSDIMKANKIKDEDIPFKFSGNRKAIIKNDFNLYNSEYTKLSQNIQNINNETEKSIKNIKNQLDELKNDINNMNKQYEETIKNISIPILLYSNQTEHNLRNLATITDELLARYIKQIKEFLNFFNTFYTHINKLTFNFSSLTKSFINITDKMNVLINNDISEYNKIIPNLNTIQIHNSLIKTKNNLYLFNDEIKYCKNELNQIKLETEELQEETKKLDIYIENFKNYTIIINNIINEIDNTLPKVVGEYEQ